MAVPESHDVFTSYAHADESLRKELDSHLALLKHKGIVRAWYDRDITGGEPWRNLIAEHLESADVILLLVSSDFFASDYCFDVEMKRALERDRTGEARVIPIVVRAVDLAGAPFEHLHWLPTGRRPVTSWPNRDEAWTDVVKGVRKSIGQLEASGARAGRRGALAPPQAKHRTDVPESREAQWAVPLEVALTGFERAIAEAHARRGGAPYPLDEIKRAGDDLAGLVDMKRILWVDDVPANNRLEIAALARLQIEVETRISTQDALEALTRNPEPYDLVISDWSRPSEGGLLPAGVRLAREMKKHRIRTPLVFYYGALAGPAESARHALAIAAGAAAATHLPGDLLRAIVEVLSHDSSP